MNNLIISAAGSGKTTYIIEQALKRVEESILITTFTQQNYKELYTRIINRVGHIPEHITLQTWFSFVIQHGVKPYQSYLYEGEIKGLHFVSQKSGISYYNKRRGFPVYYKENTIKHYLNKHNQIYSDKLAKFAHKVNEASGGLVVDRLSDIYSLIFIDESQDLAGYDLLLIKEFFKSDINVELVCDPRQTTYQTHFGDVLKKY
ncbi:MAG: UvrD-helicase domain-containing protein [Candidatus Paceibacterota bacterium]